MEPAATTDGGWWTQSYESSDSTTPTDAGFNLELLNIMAGGLGVLANAFAILVIACYRKMRERVGSGLLINQCALDLLASFAILVYHLRNVLVRSAFMAPNAGLAGELFCRLWANGLWHWSLMHASTFNLLAITIERYMMVVHPLYHKANINHKIIALACVFPWIMGFILQGSWAIPTTTMYGHACAVFAVWPSVDWFRASGAITVIASFFIPATAMVCCYARMVVVMRSKPSHRQVQPVVPAVVLNAKAKKMNRTQMNLTKTCILVVAAFLSCWITSRVFWLLYTLGVDVPMRGHFNFAALLLVDLNCSVNPFIYIFGYKEFQRGMRQVFSCGGGVAPTSGKASTSRHMNSSSTATGRLH